MDGYDDLRMRMFADPGVLLTAISASGMGIQTKEYGELTDFESGCWAAVLGHNNPEVLQVLTENAAKLIHLHQFFRTEHPSALVKELTVAAKLKGNYKGTFLSSGSEAVSLAVSLAELITGRQRKLSLSISFLGSSSELRMPRDPSCWTELDTDHCLRCPEHRECEACSICGRIDFPQLAAFVLEAGNSGGRVLFPPDKLITYLSAEVKNAGGLVIANEVTTGFGRTGKWFGFQHYKVFDAGIREPDLIALGKGLGNGYPISGVLVRSDLAHRIEASGFRYVQSHIDDPLGCVIARKVIEVMQKNSLVERGAEAGEYLRARLTEVAERTGKIKEIRGRGMMNIAVLEDTLKAKEVFASLLEMGFFVDYSEVYNLIRLYAPLIVRREEIDALCRSMELVFRADGGKADSPCIW